MLSIFVFFFFAFLAADVGSAAGYFRVYIYVFRFKGQVAYITDRASERPCLRRGAWNMLDKVVWISVYLYRFI